MSEALRMEYKGIYPKYYEKKKSKSNNVTVVVNFRGELQYGQHGIGGWTYKEIAEDTIEHQVSEELRPLIYKVSIIEE